MNFEPSTCHEEQLSQLTYNTAYEPRVIEYSGIRLFAPIIAIIIFIPSLPCVFLALFFFLLSPFFAIPPSALDPPTTHTTLDSHGLKIFQLLS